jgi:sn-glycerol 3-phosphate transport system permease protein
MVLATLASQPIRGARIYRLLLIWPFALSPAVAGTIFLFMFNPDIGSVNQVLDALFGVKPRWLDTPSLAFSLVVVASVWKNLGYNIVFYLAALQNVPAELTEAAAIDGASPLQRFLRITVPMLSQMTFFLLFTNLTFAFFESFGLIDIVTKGGPVGPAPFDAAGITTTMIYQVTVDGFGGSGNTGLAAALGNVILLFTALITVLQFRYGGRRVQYGDN